MYLLESRDALEEPSNNQYDRRMDMSFFAAGILSNLLVSSEWDFAPRPEEVNELLVGY